MEFRNWNLESPQDVDTFDSETQNNHRDSSNTIYAIGYEPQVRVNRKQFLAHLRELTQEETTAGTWEAWSCQEYHGRRPDPVRVLDVTYGNSMNRRKWNRTDKNAGE